MAGDINNIEIFATGTWVGNKKLIVTGNMLDDMVNSFNELTAKVDGFRPFLKLGHKEMQGFGGESGAPSFGFISKIWRQHDKIIANFSNVPDALVDLVNQGRYNAVSIEFLPKVTFGGSTFKSVLRAVALLGAELPAVKSLKGLSASLMSEDAYEFEDADPIETLEKEAIVPDATYSKSQVDDLVEAAVSKAIDETTTSLAESTENLVTGIAERDEKIVTLTEGKETAEKALKNYVMASDKAEVEALIDGAIDEGKVLPAEKEKYMALASIEATVKMGEDTTSARDLVASIFKDLPKRVDLSESTNGDEAGKDDGELEGNAGQIVNAKVNALIKANDGMDYKAAYDQVLADDPDLRGRYFNQEA